jgi:transcriptional regulator with XRE-family HTH domain
MSRKALFSQMLAEDPGLKAELAKVAVAADLTVLLAQSGLSRAALAERLGWTRARVTQVLSGNGNLTLETVHAVAGALGCAFDLVFRKVGESRRLQPWERGVQMSLDHGGVLHDTLDLASTAQPAAAQRLGQLRLVSGQVAPQTTPQTPQVLKQRLEQADHPMEWVHAA